MNLLKITQYSKEIKEQSPENSTEQSIRDIDTISSSDNRFKLRRYEGYDSNYHHACFYREELKKR